MERLQAWRYAVGYLEDYVVATEKAQHSQSKEMDRILKVGRSLQQKYGIALLIQRYLSIIDSLASFERRASF